MQDSNGVLRVYPGMPAFFSESSPSNLKKDTALLLKFKINNFLMSNYGAKEPFLVGST